MAGLDLAPSLIAMIYDAALEAQRWPAFLSSLADALGGQSALLRLVDWEGGRVQFVESVGYDPMFIAAYRQHFIHVDHYRKVFERIPSGVFLSDSEVPGLTLRERRNTEFHNDYERPQDKMHVLGGCLERHGPWQLQLSSQRGKRAGPFGDDQKKLLTSLCPHVIRAVNIQQTIASQAQERRMTETALDWLRIGVIFTDAEGRPCFLNRAAERLARETPGLAVRNDSIAFPSAKQTAELTTCIKNASKKSDNRPVFGSEMRVALSDGRTLQAKVIPLPVEWTSPIHAPSMKVAIFLCMPEAPAVSGPRIEQLYGLTRAEARLTAKLVEGLSVEESAWLLGITAQTARAQLRSVFAKTGARRQSELVSMLLTGLPGHCE